MAKYERIKLPERLQLLLLSMPETGMGFHQVDVKLIGGKVLRNRIVINSSLLQLDENEQLDANDIQKILLATHLSTLYISGFGSSYKPYIQPTLEEVFGGKVTYYLLKNVFTVDLHNLVEIVNQTDGKIRIIGHSTGGFLALCLYRLHPDKVMEINAINPAFDLLYSLDRNEAAKDFLKERSIVKANFKANDAYTKSDKFPVTLYQGREDDRVRIPYNVDFTERNGGQVHWFDFGHRFTEEQFRQVLSLVST
jgi:predicted esterase YcpF (UPF0227 family)